MTRCLALLLLFTALVAVANATTTQLTVTLLGTQIRVTSLTDTLIRVEPEGPSGFEDRTTFAIANRPVPSGASLTLLNQTTTEAYVQRGNLDVIHLDYQGNGSAKPTKSCTSFAHNTDANDPTNSPTYPNGVQAPDTGSCCATCQSDQQCVAWVFATSNDEADEAVNCWPLAALSGSKQGSNRVLGCADESCGGVQQPWTDITVTDLATGATTYQLSTQQSGSTPMNQLNWPSPTTATGYAFVDQPRFFVPEWGPAPMPKNASQDHASTNGYDYTNDVAGDTYLFLFPDKALASWFHSRQELLTLTGPVPLLPDYAFGTWFTYWTQYTEDVAKSEVERWKNDQLPIDIWALDMNWRNSPWGCSTCKPCDGSQTCPYEQNANHYYNHPNTDLFPDFANNGTGWFDFLQNNGLRTYFNDHPFPANLGQALQTTANEINFRWDGLSHWMDKGLTYWWFDANWGFSIPPPNTVYGGSGDGNDWEGMDNRVWGSHVYYETIRQYNLQNPTRAHTQPAQRPMSLTKYADDNMVPGLVQHQHPAQHRYPVWWTGDGVVLQASVQSMVDSGVHDFKPYVHSDCGGDYRGKVGGDLLRWAAHCVFGTILRFHGAEHQPWSYDAATEDVIRQYLNARYKLMPSFIAAGVQASQTGFPLVVRCDLFWPEHSEASSNEQYLHLNETLIAPIWDSTTNLTSRSVWIPPGTWEDGWSGARVTGPQTMTVTQPYSQIPMWHKVGGMVVTTDTPGLRVDDQDWSELVVDVYVDATNGTTGTETSIIRKRVIDRATSEVEQELSFTQHYHNDTVSLSVAPTLSSPNSVPRKWVVRLHLPKGHAVASFDTAAVVKPETLPPMPEGEMYFPFGGSGSPPAHLAGSVFEFQLLTGGSRGATSTSIELVVGAF